MLDPIIGCLIGIVVIAVVGAVITYLVERQLDRAYDEGFDAGREENTATVLKLRPQSIPGTTRVERTPTHDELEVDRLFAEISHEIRMRRASEVGS